MSQKYNQGSQLITAVLTANVPFLLPAGTVFFLTQCTGQVNIACTTKGQGGAVRNYVGATAGLKVRVLGGDGWDLCSITSPIGQTIIIFIGDDDCELASAVNVLSGTLTSIPLANASANAPTDHADITLGAATNDTASIVVNAARKWVTVGSVAANTDTVRIRGHGAGAGGTELQPGTSLTFYTQGALDIIHPGPTAGQTFTWQEQT